MPDLSDDISAAVEKATAGTAAQPASTPATDPSSPAAHAAPTASGPAPSDAPGPGAHASTDTPNAADGATTRGQASADAKPEDDAAWKAIPEPRRNKILENVRSEERQRVETEIAYAYGLTPDVSPDFVRAHLSVIASKGIVGYYHELGNALRRQGVLQAETPPPAPRTAPPPERPTVAALRTADGRSVYDATQIDQLLQWYDSRLREQLQPLYETHEETRIAQIRTEAHAQASDEFQEAMTWDGFEELREQIAELMMRDKRYTLEGAYNKLNQQRLKDLRQRIETDTRAAVLQELKHAPTPRSVTPGATGVQPRSSARTGKSLDDTFEDAVRHALAAQGS